MTTLGKPNPLDILFMLNSEFGKEANAKAKAKAKAESSPPPPKPKALTYEQRVALVLTGTSEWKPVARVAHVVIQRCRCCTSEVEYLGASHIRHESKRATPLATAWDCEVPPSPHYSLLPQIFIEHEMVVEACPACLRVESAVCTYPADVPHQRSLFN